MLNSVLWSAGNSLTTGGFLNYFASELGASTFLLALIAATPETMGLSGLATRPLLRWGVRRKSLFLVASILARTTALIIPLLAWNRPAANTEWTSWLLWMAIAVAAVFQGVSAVAYHTWLADALPVEDWGRFFAWRNISSISVQLVLPLAGASLRDYWKSHLPPEWSLITYSAVFLAGIGLQLASLWPLAQLPDVPAQLSEQRTDWSLLGTILRDGNLRWLLAHSWCLAAANGLTQAVFIKYQIQVLHLSLSRYYLLADLMWGMQIVTSWLAGWSAAKHGHRPALWWGSLAASCALPFWMIATAETWWLLLGAFLCWGAFGAVNVAGPNLMLSYAQRGDSTIELGLFRQVAGLIAGLSGIAGGLWLDALLRADFAWTVSEDITLDGYRMIFLVSWIGRVLAALLVLGVRERRSTSPRD